MEKTFRSLSTHQEIALLPYLQQKMEEPWDLYIGTDSQNIGNHTYYATVIVLHNSSKGGHILYCKEMEDRVLDTFTRLWKEVENSIELAVYLRSQHFEKIFSIDLDFNPDPKYQSNSLLRAALGYVEAMGFKARIKPYAAAASCCADYILH
jgi:predicted RNase H-related nuclease YkuK (DUF458 family)